MHCFSRSLLGLLALFNIAEACNFAGTYFAGGSINHGQPLPVALSTNVGGNRWILGLIESPHLKMVKIYIWGLTTYDYVETRYTTTWPAACSHQSTFDSTCFTGTVAGNGHYRVNLQTTCVALNTTARQQKYVDIKAAGRGIGQCAKAGGPEATSYCCSWTDTTLNTHSDCANRCSQEQACIAYSWKVSYTDCKLYDINGLSERDPSNVVGTKSLNPQRGHWDATCYVKEWSPTTTTTTTIVAALPSNCLSLKLDGSGHCQTCQVGYTVGAWSMTGKCRKCNGDYCANCSIQGYCRACRQGFDLVGSICKADQGQPCVIDANCTSNICLGGYCCQASSSTWTNCAACNDQGWCATCASGFAWVHGVGCQMATTTTTTTITTTTTWEVTTTSTTKASVCTKASHPAGCVTTPECLCYAARGIYLDPYWDRHNYGNCGKCGCLGLGLRRVRCSLTTTRATTTTAPTTTSSTTTAAPTTTTAAPTTTSSTTTAAPTTTTAAPTTTSSTTTAVPTTTTAAPTTTSSTSTASPTTTTAAPTTTSSTTTAAPTTTSAQDQPTSLTTTTTYYEVLEGALTITVSNVSQFINDPNVRAPLRKAIANMSGVNETWVVIDNITSVTTRRLRNLDFGELRVRLLSGSDFSSTLSSGCKVNFHVEVRQGGSTFVTAQLVMARINNVAFAEATQLVNNYLDAGLFGKNKYNVKVQYAVVKLRPKNMGTVPLVSPSPSPPSSNSPVIFICILVVCFAIIVASGLGAYYRLVRYRGYQRSQKTRSCSRDHSTLWDKTAAELLHPPRSITDEHRSACFEFLRSMLVAGQGGDRDVYIAFAVGKREQDVQLSGPGMYHAAAITKAFYDRGVFCQMSMPGLNDVSLETAYQQRISCKLLLVLETHALYRCVKSLQEIEAALANNIAVMRVRIEANLPKESKQWPDVCASGDMLSFRILYNLISPWSEKSLQDHDHYIDHCADDVKMKLVILNSNKLDIMITKQKTISPGETMVRPRLESDCLQQEPEQEPEQEPLLDNNALSVSGAPEGYLVEDAAVKLEPDVAQAKSKQSELGNADVGSKTAKRAPRLCKNRARPSADLPLPNPNFQHANTIAGSSSKPLKTGSRKRHPPEKIAQKRDASEQSNAFSSSKSCPSTRNNTKGSHQKRGSRKNHAASCDSPERTSTEKACSIDESQSMVVVHAATESQLPHALKQSSTEATKTPSVVKGEKNASAVKISKQRRSVVGRKKEQKPTMSVDKGDTKANKSSQSHTTSSTPVTEETEWRPSSSSRTARTKAKLQGDLTTSKSEVESWSDTKASTRGTTDTDERLTRSTPSAKAKVQRQGSSSPVRSKRGIEGTASLTKGNKGSTSPARRVKGSKTVTA